jgi:hypothetical protein
VTEAEWLACTDPQKMLRYLRVGPEDRKTLLLTCACIRRHWDLLADYRQDWILLAEEFIEERNPHADIFGDHWDGPTWIEGENLGMSWDGISGAIEQLWCAYYQVDDYDTLTRGPMWAAEVQQQVIFLHDIFGNPLRPIAIDSSWLSWNDGVVVRLAQAAYEERHLPEGTLDNTRLLILADALEEAGCTDQNLHAHSRSGGEHVRGSWVVDLVQGKE